MFPDSDGVVEDSYEEDELGDDDFDEDYQQQDMHFKQALESENLELEHEE
jgi:hypothetical protein